ncbi:MAG: ThiF family adenylyltransferase [Acidobacteriaceae bacterium]|nr:ThiF family adenylyltransferase [Acidobacteriaceae bacterium]
MLPSGSVEHELDEASRSTECNQRERYSRQVLFRPIGVAGQERIRRAAVCIVGCGALGSFQAEAFARAGAGSLRLIDRDYVDFTNLQRQWLFDEGDARNEVPKAVAAARRLHELNGDVSVEPHVSDLTPSNAEDLLAGCDLILDGTDNFETRFLINDFSVKSGTPWIYGAAIGSYGITMPIVPGGGPCFACVYPEAPTGFQPTCDVDGVIAPVTASVASMQVAMALRLIVGWPDFSCLLHTFDLWKGVSRQVSAGVRDPECEVCGKRIFEYLEGKRRVPISLCGRNAVQLHESDRPIRLDELAGRLRSVGEVRVNEFALRIDLPKYQVTIFPDGRAIVRGTTDAGVARSVYARLIGA